MLYSMLVSHVASVTKVHSAVYWTRKLETATLYTASHIKVSHHKIADGPICWASCAPRSSSVWRLGRKKKLKPNLETIVISSQKLIFRRCVTKEGAATHLCLHQPGKCQLFVLLNVLVRVWNTRLVVSGLLLVSCGETLWETVWHVTVCLSDKRTVTVFVVLSFVYSFDWRTGCWNLLIYCCFYYSMSPSGNLNALLHL